MTEADTMEAAIAHYEGFVDHYNDILDEEDDDAVTQRMDEWPLAIDLMEAHRFGDVEWQILLSTGGPATRVLVTTDYDGAVERAEFQYQDWFTPWTTPPNQNEDTVVAFANHFYFGEVHLTVDGVDV